MNTFRASDYAKLDLFGVTDGIFCQQCNCKGAYGAGLSGAISKCFPEVELAFRRNYQDNRGKQFGTYEVIQCTTTLFVANIYSQDTYGRNGTHTDISALATAVIAIAENNPDMTVYLPHHYDVKKGIHGGIGAGLGGGNWRDIENAIQCMASEKGIKNIALWDSIERRLDRIIEPHPQKEADKSISKQKDIFER